jgi:hypothetical protein
MSSRAGALDPQPPEALNSTDASFADKIGAMSRDRTTAGGVASDPNACGWLGGNDGVLPRETRRGCQANG